jgi:hypothetical protein
MVCDRRTGFGAVEFGGGEFGVGEFWLGELGWVWVHDADGRADRLPLDVLGVRGEAFLFLEASLGFGEPVTELLLGA